MKICLIDNYDSFTYNLEHQLRSFDLVVDVIRNDIDRPGKPVKIAIPLSSYEHAIQYNK